MHLRFHFQVFLVSLAVLSSQVTNLNAAELQIAFWNVENLFDLKDDPAVELDEEFTPSAKKRWTTERLEIKLNNLSRVIRTMNGGKGPDILGLAEVENSAVVEMLIKHLKLSRDYGIVHQNSPSFRGIDTALIYDKKVVKLKSSQFIRIPNATTRDIVEAEFQMLGRGSQASFYVHCNHWPSRRSPDEARVKVASVLRKRLDGIQAKNPDADVILIGDFNDFPDNISVAKTLRAKDNPERLSKGELYDAMWPLHRDPNAGTYVYQNKWNVLDHVIVSQGLFDRQGLSLKLKSVGVVANDFQYYRPREGLARPSRSYSGNRFHSNGYSDHFPVVATFETK